MTTLKPFDNLLAIEVPIDSKYKKFGKSIEVMSKEGLQVIKTNYHFKILGYVTPTEIDFDVETYVDVVESAVWETKWVDFTHNETWLYTKDQSFRSLLSYNGIEIKEGYKLVILEKQ